VLQPHSLKTPEIQQQLATFHAEVMVVAAYGLILPRMVLQLPRLGCINIHASLLPRWRGAAPIQRAILAGDTETGITLMQMDEGLDTGDMLLRLSCPITPTDDAQSLHDKLAALGAQAIVGALHELEDGHLAPVVQDEKQATYAAKLSKAEAHIDWTQDAVQIARAVRAYNPFPVVHSILHGTPLKIWRASVRDDMQGDAGTVLMVVPEGVIVACGRGALCLEVLQRPNAKALSAAQFLQGYTIHPGDRFAPPA
jgi:methionyl-tRNA formyltransferase